MWILYTVTNNIPIDPLLALIYNTCVCAVLIFGCKYTCPFGKYGYKRRVVQNRSMYASDTLLR